MDQVSKNRFKYNNKIISSQHTISQFCPPKLSKQSHLYVPGRLIQARAALQGCIILHSSISSEQSIPVQPGSKYLNKYFLSFFLFNLILHTTNTCITIW